MDNIISSDKYIKVVKNGHIGEIILNRPNEYNRMDDNFFTKFKESVELCDNDKDIRVILIWAEGKMFTSGLDLRSVGSVVLSCMLAIIDPNFYHLKLFYKQMIIDQMLKRILIYISSLKGGRALSILFKKQISLL